MATLQDALDAVNAAKARVDTDISTLQSTVADLQAQLGNVPPAVDFQPVIDAANAIDPAPAAAPVAPADGSVG